MAKVIYATIETNSENTDADAATLYFDGTPTQEELKEAFNNFSAWFARYQGSEPNLIAIPDEILGAPGLSRLPMPCWAAPNALCVHRYQCITG